MIKCEKCLKESKKPVNCFDIEEILEYVEVAKKLEKSNRELWDLLTEGGFVVDETEPGVDLFFSPELTEETKKYQSNGNSIINFLEIANHHIKKNHGLDGEEVLQCIKETKLRGDEIGICEKQNKALECPQKLNYQPLDGKCVNEKEKLKGAEDTHYGRFMKNSYNDCEFLKK
jgi:Asp-tRNA(Asn)/Glu-tRNA(Gln) amidotransferase C subunit